MNNDKYSRKVILLCPTCGNTQFEHEENMDVDYSLIHCPSCGRNFTKSELIRENQSIVDNNVEEIKKEIAKDLKKDLKKLLKNI